MAVIKDFQDSLHLLPLYLGILLVLWVVGKIIYLRYFHPLANVPGPFLASISELYRFYYNYIKNGSYYLKFEGFQAKYGENSTDVVIVREANNHHPDDRPSYPYRPKRGATH
jgi:hypothetical protein